MLQNDIDLDLKTKLIESGTTQTEIAEKVGVIPCLCESHHQGPGADRE